MRTLLSILFVGLTSLFFVACKGGDEQNGTDVNAPNTLESLLNPNANPATTTIATPATVSSMSVSDIWVLAGVNSKEKYEVNLVNNIPMMTIDSSKNSLSGHTGCNSLEGKVKVQETQFQFSEVKLTSDQPCTNIAFEKKFISTLKSGALTYKLVNDTLSLNAGGATEFLFRRIRRN